MDITWYIIASAQNDANERSKTQFSYCASPKTWQWITITLKKYIFLNAL